MTKQENVLGKGARVESSRVKDPRRAAPPRGSKSRVHGNGVSLLVVSCLSSCLVHVCSDSRSSLLASISLSQDGLQCRGFWEIDKTFYELASSPCFWSLPDSPS